MLLNILVALQFNGCESGFLSKTTVEMTNNLNNMQLGLHCQDENHDFGFQALLPDQKWSFSVKPNFFLSVVLCFRHFFWIGEDHWFDVYDQKRDIASGRFLACEIIETGPCRNAEEVRQCFKWNQDIDEAGHWFVNVEEAPCCFVNVEEAPCSWK